MREKEYIERDAAILEFETNGSNFVYGQKTCNAIISRLKIIPAADVVEVVRCGECKFWNAPPSCEGLARCQTGESGVRFRKAYDFCSRGRKKMDGGVNDG